MRVPMKLLVIEDETKLAEYLRKGLTEAHPRRKFVELHLANKSSIEGKRRLNTL